MDLLQLLNFKHIAVQCHDNPDADAIAAGFALYRFFKNHGKKTALFYSGSKKVSKPNLVNMLQLLDIPLEHCPDPVAWSDLLITVDCQHGAGNVSPMSAPHLAVIDHHIEEFTPPPLHDIRPDLGSCSTLVWKLLGDVGFAIDRTLGTALFYGLYTDTGALSEVRHPLDRDLRDSLPVNERILKTLKNSNLSLHDLDLVSSALKGLHFDRAGRFALVSSAPCDPNVLGFVSDLILQVDKVDTGVVFCEVPGGIKYSVRTKAREAKAAHIAAWLASGGLGSGGGHAEKAGGYISWKNLLETENSTDLVEFFRDRLVRYFNSYTIIDCASPGIDPKNFLQSTPICEYAKLPVQLAYVPCADLIPELSSGLNPDFEPDPNGGRTQLYIRMLEGDITIDAAADILLMIGLRGEVYPISAEKFRASYIPTENRAELAFEYDPVILDKNNHTRVALKPHCRTCLGRGSGLVRAARLEQGLKLFTCWDNDNYLLGEPGDWLVWSPADPADMYIITADIFPCLYTATEKPRAEDYTGRQLAELPGSQRVRKKPQQVKVIFAKAAGVVQTLEGPVKYSPGTALLTAETGETWPVTPEHFRTAYAPTPGGEYTQDGAFIAQPTEAWAWRPDHLFCVSLENGSILTGRPGDHLLQYSDNSYGIVAARLFPELYEPITEV